MPVNKGDLNLMTVKDKVDKTFRLKRSTRFDLLSKMLGSPNSLRGMVDTQLTVGLSDRNNTQAFDNASVSYNTSTPTAADDASSASNSSAVSSNSSNPTFSTLTTTSTDGGGPYYHDDSVPTYLEIKDSELAQCFLLTPTNNSKDFRELDRKVRYRVSGVNATIVASIEQITTFHDNRSYTFRYPGLRVERHEKVCYLEVAVPENQVVMVVVSEGPAPQTGPAAVALYDSVMAEKLSLPSLYFQKLPRKRVFISMFRKVVLKLSFNVLDYRVRIMCRALVLPVELEQQQTRPNAGYVQSPLYGWGHTFSLLFHAFLRPSLQLIVPHAHVLMKSFPIQQLRGCLSLSFVSSATGQTTQQEMCCKPHVAPAVHNVSALTVTFHVVEVFDERFADDYNCYSHNGFMVPDPMQYTNGFRMLYSFHEAQHAPRRLRGLKWDCTGQAWPQFQHHLRCNFVSECQGGEDEVGCPSYTSSAPCRPGAFLAGDACLFLVVVSPRVGPYAVYWAEGSAACVEEGGEMASLLTPERLGKAMEVLSVSAAPSDTFCVGLASPSGSLPMWQVSFTAL